MPPTDVDVLIMDLRKAVLQMDPDRLILGLLRQVEAHLPQGTRVNVSSGHIDVHLHRPEDYHYLPRTLVQVVDSISYLDGIYQTRWLKHRCAPTEPLPPRVDRFRMESHQPRVLTAYEHLLND